MRVAAARPAYLYRGAIHGTGRLLAPAIPVASSDFPAPINRVHAIQSDHCINAHQWRATTDDDEHYVYAIGL